MVAAGQEPDIFTVNNVLRDRFASEGRILDLRPFAEEGPWSDGLCASLREDYEAVREGAAGEGVTLPVWVAADDA